MKEILYTILLLLYIASPILSQDRLSEDQLSLEALFIEAKKKMLIGEYDAALTVYEKILERDVNNSVVAFELSKLYENQGKLGEAIKNINHAIGVESRNKWYLLQKAKLLQKANEYPEAASTFELLYKQDPANHEFLQEQAFCLIKANQLKEAIDVFERLQAKIGISENLALIKHDLYKQLEKKKQAENELVQLCEKFPENLDYKHLLANYYKQSGQEKKAEEIYEEILTFNAEDPRAKIALAKKYRENNDRKNYLESIEPIIKNASAGIDIKINELMPYVMELQKKFDPDLFEQLKSIGQILVGAHEDDAKAYAIYGDILSMGKANTEAIKAYQRTLELDETNYAVWEQMLLLMADEKEMEDLSTYSLQALDLFPNQRLIYYLSGLAEASLGNYPAAKGSLEEALLMSNRDPELKFSLNALLGDVYHQLGEYKQSNESYEQALKINPDQPFVQNDYAWRLALRGDNLGYAAELINRSLKSEANNPRFLGTKAWVAFKAGDNELAKKTMLQSMDQGGKDIAYLLEKYGDILFVAGQEDQAIKMWMEAKEKGLEKELLDRKISEKKFLPEQL